MLYPVAPMEATMLGMGKVVLALAFLISAPIIAVAQTSDGPSSNSPPATQSQPEIGRATRLNSSHLAVSRMPSSA